MKTTLTVEIEYDPTMTDPEGLACAMDRLLETSLSTPGIMDEYGNPSVREFFVARETEAALKAAGMELRQSAASARRGARTIELPCYGITVRLSRENWTDKRRGSIVTDLREPETAANRQYNAAIDGLEALILAHARAGVDVESPAYLEGIETAVDAIANHEA